MLNPGGILVIGDEFLPQAETREAAVRKFHAYRNQLAQEGIIPFEEGIFEQDLHQDGEYKTTVTELERQLATFGFQSQRTKNVESDFDVDHELLGNKVVYGIK